MSDDVAPRLSPSARPTLAEATRVWARIGLTSFGGPAGQIALMHRELVEERRWIGEERFLHALGYCMILPGPEAQQLAIYIGWLMHRTPGGLVAGLLFVLPGAIVLLALSILYALFRHTPLIDAVFFGIKPAVVAVVVGAVVRIGRRALTTRASVVIAAAAFLAVAAFRIPFPLVVLAAACLGWFGHGYAPGLFLATPHGASAGTAADDDGIIDRMFARGELGHADPSWIRAARVLAVWLPIWLGPVAVLWALTGSHGIWTTMGTFFATMAVVTFGGAYAVLAYVAQAAVTSLGWLTPGEMLDGLALAETTPGPLIIVLQFVGFLAASRAAGPLDPLVAGALGALLTTWVTFAPCFLWIFLGAPWVETLRKDERIAAALAIVTSAIVGVILNLAFWFALHVVFREVRVFEAMGLRAEAPILASLDWRAAGLALFAMVLTLRLRLGMLPTLAICAASGVALLRLAP